MEMRWLALVSARVFDRACEDRAELEGNKKRDLGEAAIVRRSGNDETDEIISYLAGSGGYRGECRELNGRWQLNRAESSPSRGAMTCRDCPCPGGNLGTADPSSRESRPLHTTAQRIVEID